MSNQRSFSELEYMGKKRLTRREKFLNEMDDIIPWSKLLVIIEPYYPKSGQPGRQPVGLSKMFRIHCMQNWFNFSDRQMEDALYEIESVRRFAGFTSVLDALPDETTILNLRHLLAEHDLTQQILTTINAHLKEQGLMISQGTMVDATIIESMGSDTILITLVNKLISNLIVGRSRYRGEKPSLHLSCLILYQ